MTAWLLSVWLELYTGISTWTLKSLSNLCGRGSCSSSTRSVAWVPLGRVAVLAPGLVLGLPKLTLGRHQRLPHSPPKMLCT